MATPTNSPSDPRIACEVGDDGIATVTIRRPDKRNALALSMWIALGAVFRALGADGAVRAVILAGEGGHFSAGADISEFPQVRADAQAGLAYDRINDEATVAIRDCPRPVIAALSGYAVGGGLGIALACDFRVADRTVRTGITAARLGLVYSILDCSLVARCVGVTAAKEILFSGEIFGADDALRLGLVDRLVEEDAMAAARAFAERLAAGAPLSHAGNKAIVNAIADGTVHHRHGELERLIARAFDSEDYAEGQRAFAQKRPARFVGA